MLAFFSSPLRPHQSFTLDTKYPSSNGNIVYGSHKQIYHDLSVLKPLSMTKFPVQLVSSRITKLTYAMKVFPHENGHSPLYFKNESRFACLRHPNVIRYLFCEEKRQAKFDNKEANISYTITEYAQKGDFLNFLKNHHKSIEDKLARTYFKQLIEGIEYLHKSGVSHMDIKLENLLLDQEFTLKIADFDMAHFTDDAIIISNGTKYFRAPEVAQGKCNDTKAADIFAAGITLFTLKTKGVLPQFENEVMGDIDFADLLYNNTNEFWARHAKLQKQNEVTFDKDFKDLFEAMTKLNPSDRASIDAIKNSKWYNGPCYTAVELKEKMARLFSQ